MSIYCSYHLPHIMNHNTHQSSGSVLVLWLECMFVITLCGALHPLTTSGLPVAHMSWLQNDFFFLITHTVYLHRVYAFGLRQSVIVKITKLYWHFLVCLQTGTWHRTGLLLRMSAMRRDWCSPSPCSTWLRPTCPSLASGLSPPQWCHQWTLAS